MKQFCVEGLRNLPGVGGEEERREEKGLIT